MAAVMVPSDGSEPQDVVLLFGIIDVLQVKVPCSFAEPKLPLGGKSEQGC